MTDYDEELTETILTGTKIDATITLGGERSLGSSSAAKVVIQRYSKATGIVEVATIYNESDEIIEDWFNEINNEGGE